MSSTPKPLQEAMRAAPATLVSVILHLVLLIACGLLIFSENTVDPLVIEIAQNDSQDDETSIPWETISLEAEPELLEPTPLIEDIVEVDADLAIDEVVEITTPFLPEITVVASSAEEAPKFEFPPGLSIEFTESIRYARENGIDIVIVFDSTGSMGPEIETVKNRIGAIGRLILSKIPQAQFSLVTYRDRRDAYLVRGIPLTNDINKVQQFIYSVGAQGGGDHPEALEAGMGWAINKLYYRPNSLKVMLIFGDAPPHQHHLNACLKMANHFRERGKGKVSTITCRSHIPLPQFYAIATHGGGEAYTLANARGLMEELLILAFGREHRSDVLKFFELEPDPD